MTSEEIVKEIQTRGAADPDLMGELYKNLEGWINRAILPYRGFSDAQEAEEKYKWQDLRHEAFIALYAAVKTYRDTEGSSFLSWYNRYYLRPALREYSYRSYGISVPKTHMDRLRGFRRDVEKLEETLQRPATDEDLIKILEYDPEALAAYHAQMDLLKIARLDNPTEDAEGGQVTLADLLPDPSELPEDEITARITREQEAAEVWAEVDALPDRMAWAIREEYREGRKAAELAGEAGVTRQCIDQYEKRGLDRLRRSKRIRRIAEDEGIFSQAVKGISIRRFYETGSSATERVALERVEQWEQKKRRA